MALSPDEMLTAYRATPRTLQALVDGLDESQLRWRRDEDAWSIIEVIAHLADAEDNSHERVRRMLAGGRPQFQDYDEKAWARDRDYRSKTLADVLSRFCDQRAAHVQTLEALDEPGWQQFGDHTTLGTITVASITEHMITHDMMHLGQISDSVLDQSRA
ncbi:bacillithiol transferase BstA [soil metagenome]